MPAPRSIAASWLSSRRQAWLRHAIAAEEDVFGAGEGTALGGVGAENGKLNCARAGAAQRTRAGKAPPSPRKAMAMVVPIMEPGPTPGPRMGSAAMVTKV